MKILPLIGAAAVAVASFLGGGCSAVNTNRLPGTPYSAVDFRGSFDSVKYNVKLGKKAQTTRTHPDDTRLPPTDTEAPLDSYAANRLRFGLEVSFGIDNELRFKAGADIGYGFSKEGEEVIILEERRQATDIPGSESYAFTRLTQDRFTFTPVIGAERDFYGVFRIGVEGGFPYTGFDVESGYDRFGQWQTVKNNSWSGYGKRFGINLDVLDSEYVMLPFRGMYIFAGNESFSPEVGGEKGTIKTTIFSFGKRWRF